MCALVEDALARARRDENRVGAARTAPALPEEPLDEHLSKELLEALGVATPQRRGCPDREAARDALATLGVPVVVKLLDPGVTHKAALGGVHVGITSAADL